MPQPPNAIQKRWREAVRQECSAISYDLPCEIHHPAGRTAKQGRIPIGHWFILALTPEEHACIDQGTKGLRELKARFAIWHPNVEACLFQALSLHGFEKFLFSNIDLEYPFGKDVFEAIHSWQR